LRTGKRMDTHYSLLVMGGRQPRKADNLAAILVPSVQKMLEPRRLTTLRIKKRITNQTPWPESASELYRPSDRRLSARLVPTFADRGMSRSQRGGSPTNCNLCFLDRSRYFSFRVVPQWYSLLLRAVLHGIGYLKPLNVKISFSSLVYVY
jgi:hypothetical protein